MRTHLRLACLLVTFGLTVLSGCAAPVSGSGGGPGGADDALGGKADDAADDAACIARGGSYDGVELTRREAELVLEMVNKGDSRVLDVGVGAGLDADTARNIAVAREERGGICNLSELADIRQVGPANMERARQFTAVWELADGGEATLDQLMADGGTYDGAEFTAGEAFIALEMASYASPAQLDAIPYFRSDVARRLVQERRARGGFRSLGEVADVFGVGSRHMEYLQSGMADWRRFARAAYAQCGSLDTVDAAPSPLATGCPGLSIEGETLRGELEGISFTQHEAALTLDFVNSADLATIDAVLDRRAANAIVGVRDRHAICDLTRLGDVHYVGPAGLAKLRRFTATWEASKRGEGELAELMSPGARADGMAPINRYEERLIVEMANFATEEQLDAMPRFRSDAARNVAQAARRGIHSIADLDGVQQVGPAHIDYLAENIHMWRAFIRETEERPACAAFNRDPGLDEPTSILTPGEAEKVRRELDNICPDTWCGGDFNWYVDTVHCPGDGTCFVAMRTTGYDASWSSDMLDGRPASALTRNAAADDGTHEARIDDAYSDDGEVWLDVACTMDAGFFAREDVMNVDRGRYSEKLYGTVLDCVSSLEEMMRAL